MDSC
ncbi:hypothetical protein LINPERPRIM_LOCUS17177 [Linum perenne]|jgi:hypothetical protein